MKLSSKSDLVSQLTISLLLVITGLWVPTIHLFFLNSVNFTLPFSVHLPLLGLLSAGIFSLSFLLLLISPARIRSGLSCFLLFLGIFFWAESTLLIGDFGFLQGGDMDWGKNQYLLYLEILLVGLFGFLSFRFRENLMRKTGLIFLVVIISSLANIFPAFQAHMSRTKTPTRHTFTQEGVLQLSPEKNVLIYIIDTFQSDVFAEIITDQPELKNTLDGFTYFPNSISAFPKTYASIPNILTGKAFDNSTPFPLFLRDAYLANSAPKVLKEKGFDVRYRSFTWQPYLADPLVADNLTDIKSAEGRQWMQSHEFNQLSNLALFRLSPFLLKPWVYNDNEFRLRESPIPQDTSHPVDHLSEVESVYSGGNKVEDLKFHDEVMAFLSTEGNKPAFRVFHFAGVHEPLSLDQDLNYIGKQSNSRGPFKEQAIGMLKMLDLEFQRLREIGAYDNSLIFVVGDHGCGEHRQVGFRSAAALDLGLEIDLNIPDNPVGEEVIRGAVPVILVKPMGSSGIMDLSTAPVQLGDIPNTIFQELGYGKAADGPSILEIPESSDRKRYHRQYRFAGWGQDFIVPLTEFEVSGFSWAPSSWAPTGRDLNQLAVETIDGQLIILGQGGNLDSFDHEGWINPEAQGRFFTGGKASISIPVKGDSKTKWIGIRTRPYRASKTPVPLTVTINSKPVATWNFSSASPEYIKSTIPHRLFEAGKTFDLGFEFGDPDKSGPFFIEIRIIDVPDFTPFTIGDSLSFVTKGNSVDYVREGFYHHENWGTWTVGHSARICMTLDALPTEDLEIEMKLRPAVFPKSPPVIADVVANGTLMKQLSFTKNGWHTLSFTLPKELISESHELDLLFTIHNPRAARDYKKTGDARKIGLGFSHLIIRSGETGRVDENSPIDKNLIQERKYTKKIKGLYPSEKWADKPVAWTNGSAGFQLEIPKQGVPTVLKITVEAGTPGNSDLVVYANNTLVAAPNIKTYPWNGVVDLATVPISEKLNLVLLSATHTPASINPASGDKRKLGAALSLVELKRTPTSDKGPWQSISLLDKPHQQDLTPNNTESSPWSGVFNTENWHEGPTTWTKDKATCTTLWNRSRKPRYLLLDIASVGPSGTHLSVLANDSQVVFDQLIDAPGPQIIDLTQVPQADQLIFSLSSSTFIPAECRAESTDKRVLGIALRQVLLME